MLEQIYTHMPELLIKTTIVLLLAYLACKLLKHKSAALKVQIWLCSLLLVLMLPLFMLWLPSLNIVPDDLLTDQMPLGFSQQTESGAAPSYLKVTGNGNIDSASSDTLASAMLVTVLWGVGSLFMLLHILIQRQQAKRLLRRAEVADDLRQLMVECGPLPDTPVFYSDELVTPVALGVRQPVILLPYSSRYWQPEQLYAAILHEQAHVQNSDNLARLIGLLSRALLWFHPLAWLGVNQLKQEQEKAADDRVISSGVTASSYAKSLLDIVKTINGQDGQRGLVASMGSYSFFPQRMKAILAEHQDRSQSDSVSKILVFALVLAISLPIAAITTESDQDAFQSVPELIMETHHGENGSSNGTGSEDFYANGGNLTLEQGSELLLSAAKKADKSLLELLFESGAKASPGAQNIMITQAVERGDIYLLELFLEAGMSLQNTNQDRLLEQTVDRADFKMTALLLLGGIDVTQDKMQELLKEAENRGDKKMLVLLLEAQRFR